MRGDAPRQPSQRPLLFHLVLLVLTCVLPVVGFSAVLTIRNYQQHWQSTERQLTASAHALTTALDRELDHARSALLTLGISSRLHSGDYAAFYAEAVAVAHRLGARIMLADAQGNRLFNTDTPYGTRLPPMVNAEAVRRVAETRAPVVLGLFEDRRDPGLRYGILVPIESAGRVVNVLGMSVRPESLAEALGVAQVPAIWRAAILDGAGRIVWRNRDTARFVGQAGNADPFLATGTAKGIFLVRSNDDIPVYTAMSRSTLSGWKAVVGAPCSAVDPALDGSLASVIGGGLLVLLVGIAISTVLGRRLQRSVGDLIAAAEALGRGRPLPGFATPVRELAALGAALADTTQLIAQERRRRDAAEESLRRGEAILAHAQRIAAIGSWEWDLASGTIRWSAAMYQLFQLAPDRTVPSRARLVALVHPHDRARAAHWLASLTGEPAPSGIEFRIQRTDGAIRTVHCHSEPARDAAGTLVKIAGTMQDITERKRIEEELWRAKADAEAANRAKPDFLANMSHELRTPLNAVIGFSDIIENRRVGPLGNEKYAEYAVHIRQSGEHLLELITEILDYAKIDAGRMTLADESVAMGVLVDACAAMVGPQAAQAGLQLTTTVGADVGSVRGDDRRLKQILLNLLSNAVKFTPRGGCIELRALVEPDGRLLVEVRDTGIGIAQKDMARVLQPFGQVDNAHNRRAEGTGLGLPLTKRLVELHDGTLTLESAPGQGTTASVHLPAQRVFRAVA